MQSRAKHGISYKKYQRTADTRECDVRFKDLLMHSISYKHNCGHIGVVHISLCQKKQKLEFCFGLLGALEGWYVDPTKRFSNL